MLSDWLQNLCACELFFWGGQFISSTPVSSYYSLAEESTERGRERAGGGREKRGRKKEMGGSLGGDHCCACEGGDVDMFEFIRGNKNYFLSLSPDFLLTCPSLM